MIVQQKYQATAASDKAQLEGALLVNRAVQVRRDRIRTVLRVAGNADRISAETFDAVMAVLGLDVNPGTTR